MVGLPTRNSLDRATAMLPRLLYERLGEMGLDFAISYPDHALFFPAIRDHELQLAAYRMFIVERGSAFTIRLGFRTGERRSQAKP
jgi:hypothetical protein